MTLSPMLASIRGIGHSPLMPMTGLSKALSGLAVTQPILKSYLTVAAKTGHTDPRTTRSFISAENRLTIPRLAQDVAPRVWWRERPGEEERPTPDSPSFPSWGHRRPDEPLGSLHNRVPTQNGTVDAVVRCAGRVINLIIGRRHHRLALADHARRPFHDNDWSRSATTAHSSQGITTPRGPLKPADPKTRISPALGLRRCRPALRMVVDAHWVEGSD